MSLLSDEEFDKLVKGLDVIPPHLLKSWYDTDENSTDETRLYILAIGIAMKYVIIQDFNLPEDVPPNLWESIFSEKDIKLRVTTIMAGLDYELFIVEGNSFRAWLKRFLQDFNCRNRLTMFDVIVECSNALYPNGRDGDFEDKVEKKRIDDWLSANITGYGSSAYKETLISAINPAKKEKAKITLKRKK